MTIPFVLFVSLLLHGVILFLLAPNLLRPPIDPESPLPVSLIPPEKQRPLPREIEDPPPPIKDPEEPKKASHLGPKEQQVEKEMAPKAEGATDQQPQPARQSVPAPPRPSTPPEATESKRPQPEGAPATVPEQPKATQGDKPQPVKKKKAPRRPAKKKVAKRPPQKPARSMEPQTPPLRDLLQLPDATRRSFERKKRDLPDGNQAQISTREDILNSFFRRFKTNVMGSWNYPRISRQRLEQGAVRTRLTVNRRGELLDLQLINSSGYAALDKAAFDAVRRSSPYGPYSSYYPKDTMTFDVLFVYRIYGGVQDKNLYRR